MGKPLHGRESPAVLAAPIASVNHNAQAVPQHTCLRPASGSCWCTAARRSFMRCSTPTRGTVQHTVKAAQQQPPRKCIWGLLAHSRGALPALFVVQRRPKPHDQHTCQAACPAHIPAPTRRCNP